VVVEEDVLQYIHHCFQVVSSLSTLNQDLDNPCCTSLFSHVFSQHVQRWSVKQYGIMRMSQMLYLVTQCLDERLLSAARQDNQELLQQVFEEGNFDINYKDGCVITTESVC
jgi:hypothetical protein